jgi:hypothetical protein
MKRKCRRCHLRWEQVNNRCRRCETAVIEEQERIAAEGPAKPFTPGYARPGGYGVRAYIPGMVALSFFGTVWNRR